MSDQIVFCAFHPFLVEVQTNAGYIHVQLYKIHNVTTSRLGLRALLVTCNKLTHFMQKILKKLIGFIFGNGFI